MNETEKEDPNVFYVFLGRNQDKSKFKKKDEYDVMGMTKDREKALKIMQDLKQNKGRKLSNNTYYTTIELMEEPSSTIIDIWEE